MDDLTEISASPDEQLAELKQIEAENEQLEAQLRLERYELALKQAIEKYPALAEDIQRSLQTPQLGSHHNEGPRMNAHIELIIGTLYEICRGKFADELPAEIRDLITQVAVVEDPKNASNKIPNPELLDYAFLHDIAKPVCLSVRVSGRADTIEISWEQWLEIEAKGEPYRVTVGASSDEESESEQIIESISYYHESQKDQGKHGNVGAEMVVKSGAKVSPEILQAMRLHEVAYEFKRIQGRTYEEHFVEPGFSEKQQNLIIAVSYIDLMASLGADKKPDLSSLIYLAQSRANTQLIATALADGAVIKDNAIGKLKKSDRVLTAADLKAVDERKSYNLATIELGLEKLVAETMITPTQSVEIMTIIRSEKTPSVVLGQKYGALNRLLRPILVQAEE